MLDLVQLSVFCLLCVIGYFAWQSILCREFALNRVRQHCQRQQLQLLDDTISLRALWFKRNTRGHLSFWCCFYFEFASIGERRYHGKINILGKSVLNIELEAHKIPASTDGETQ